MAVTDEPADSLQRYLKEVAASSPLTAKEEALLSSRIQEGDLEARARLVEANLRFVVLIAREYEKQKVPLADLISAGNVGLITAAERFDASRGYKFITYAVWWIRQAILQTIAETPRTVRLPLNRVDLLRRISRYVNGRSQEATESPTEDEIADALGVPVAEILDTMAKGGFDVSLDAETAGEPESSLLGKLSDENQEAPDALAMRNILKEDIEEALMTLDEREREVIRLYFGLGGVDTLTLEEIGVQFGLTRERVRQIKERALAKLRSPKRAKRLMSYVE